MKNPFRPAFLVFLLFAVSCEKGGDNINSRSYTGYLSDKAIVSIRIFGDDIWILSWKICDTCYMAPFMSYRPMISQLTVINDHGFDYEEPTVVSIPVADHHGNLYTSTNNQVFKINGIGDYSLILDTEGFQFNYFSFDKNDNIWLGGYNGIAFWNGSTLNVYDTINSLLPTNITHGMAIDSSDNKWIATDFKGLLKIAGDNWEIIPNSAIPGLGEHSYLLSPLADEDNNIWFSVFNPDAGSNILMFDGSEWNYQYAGQVSHASLNMDSEGTVWIISNEYEFSTFKKSTLLYYYENNWADFEVSTVNSAILAVNADAGKVYIGTVNGLRVIEK